MRSSSLSAWDPRKGMPKILSAVRDKIFVGCLALKPNVAQLTHTEQNQISCSCPISEDCFLFAFNSPCKWFHTVCLLFVSIKGLQMAVMYEESTSLQIACMGYSPRYSLPPFWDDSPDVTWRRLYYRWVTLRLFMLRKEIYCDFSFAQRYHSKITINLHFYFSLCYLFNSCSKERKAVYFSKIS